MKKGMHPNSLNNLKNSPRTGTRHSYAVLAKLTHRMMTMKFTVVQLAKYAGISYSSANRWTAELHAAKCVHVIEYLRSPNNRTTSRVYQWGAGDDVPKPAKLLSKLYHRQWRQKRSTLEGALNAISRKSY